jgi:DHA1 family multidrug resistance protein-like MFS transporter
MFGKVEYSPMDKRRFLITATVFIDVLGLGIIIPILPFYVESFGSGALTITALTAVYSFFAFFSAPLLGSLSDKYGRKPILVQSLFTTALGWFIFASAKNIPMMFLGRIIDGISAGNFSTAQSYLVDISKDQKERSANLGIIGAAFGIGFILGPAMGGFLGAISPSFPFWVVAVLASINTILTMVFLPESLKNKSKNKVSFNPFTPIMKAVRDLNMRSFYVTWLLFGIAFSSMNAVFSLYIQKQFGWGHVISGSLLTLVGLIIAVNQGFAIKNFWLKYFKEHHLAKYLILVLSFGFLIMDIPLASGFLIGLFIVSFSQSVARIALTGQTVAVSDKNAHGEVMGILSALMSLGMIVGPLCAGLLFEISEYYPFIFSSALCLAGFLIIFKHLKDFGEKDLEEGEDVEIPEAV